MLDGPGVVAEHVASPDAEPAALEDDHAAGFERALAAEQFRAARIGTISGRGAIRVSG